MVIENIWLTNIDKKQRSDLTNGILIKGSVTCSKGKFDF